MSNTRWDVVAEAGTRKNVLWWYLNKAFFQRMLSLRANTGNFFSSVQDKRKEDQEEVK